MGVVQLIAFGRHDAWQAAGKRMGAAENLFDCCGLNDLGLCVYMFRLKIRGRIGTNTRMTSYFGEDGSRTR